MPRAGLSRESVIAAAASLADESGYASLTLSALAGRLGIRQPSLYKHIESLSGLQREVALGAKRELAQVLARASVGRSGADALRALAEAYRAWANLHPGRYAATVRAPAAEDPEDQLLSAEALGILKDALSGFGLQPDATIDAARTLRSAIHGFVSLEQSAGFGMPRDLGDSYQFMMDTLVSGLKRASVDPTA